MKRILIISDLHVGSEVAITPKTTNLTEEQLFMKDVWERNIDHFDILTDPYDYLFLLGDCVDGPNPKSSGRGVYTVDMHEQTHHAVELIRPLIGGQTELYGVTGSGYHVTTLKQDFDYDRKIYEELGIRQSSYYSKLIEIEDKIFSIKHEPESMSLDRLSTPLQKAFDRFSRSLFYGGKKINFDIRGHLHLRASLQIADWYGIIAPCFQLRTSYMMRKSSYFRPDLGMLAIYLEEDSFVIKEPPRIPIPDHLLYLEVGEDEEEGRDILSEIEFEEVEEYREQLRKDFYGED